MIIKPIQMSPVRMAEHPSLLVTRMANPNPRASTTCALRNPPEKKEEPKHSEVDLSFNEAILSTEEDQRLFRRRLLCEYANDEEEDEEDDEEENGLERARLPAGEPRMIPPSRDCGVGTSTIVPAPNRERSGIEEVEA